MASNWLNVEKRRGKQQAKQTNKASDQQQIITIRIITKPKRASAEIEKSVVIIIKIGVQLFSFSIQLCL